MSALGRFALKVARRLARPHRRVQRFLRDAAAFDGPVSVLEPGGGNVMVLAPHFDDEVLGCGGTLALHVAAGATITVVFLTDSRYVGANAELPQRERQRLHDELLAVRKREAMAAAAQLALSKVLFLDGDPERFGHSGELAQRLRKIMASIRPAIVYVPAFLDRHPDHRASNAVLDNAVRGESFEFECRAYEVWTPLIPNRLVSIDATMDLKLAALACHASQLAHTDFTHMVRGLNAYRAAGIPDGASHYAEAFFAATLREYLELYADFTDRA